MKNLKYTLILNTSCKYYHDDDTVTSFKTGVSIP